MGRYKDYREPKRRGFEFEPQEPMIERRVSVPRPSVSQGADPVDATLKWFNADKGFGFVALPDGSEAFLHIRPLEAAGHSSLPDGAQLKVRVGQGPKGPQVTEVIEVNAGSGSSGDTHRAPRPPAPRSMAPRQQNSGPTEELVGTVKWYNATKGFGFIAPDGGAKDVFVHATSLERSGLSGLADGQRVTMQVGQGQKGLEVRTLKPLD